MELGSSFEGLYVKNVCNVNEVIDLLWKVNLVRNILF